MTTKATNLNTQQQQRQDEGTATNRETREPHGANTTTTSEASIQKAIRFWNHPSLRTISATDKIAYLRSQNITDAELHGAWERIAEQDATRATNVQDYNNRGGHSASLHSPRHELQQPIVQQPPSYGGVDTGHQQQLPHYHNYDDDTHNNNAAILLTVGGMLGLSAAAAVRWLNGGDFCLFPPATHSTTEESPGNVGVDEESSHEAETANVARATKSPIYEEDDNDGLFVAADDEIIPDEEEHMEGHNHILLDHVQELTTILKSHVASQERILQKLAATDQRQVTDRSMDLLRPQEPPEHTSSTGWALVWAQLVELRAQLDHIKTGEEETTTEELQVNLLRKLSKCIQRLETEIGVKSSDTVVENDNASPASKKSVSTDSSSTASTSTPSPSSRGKTDCNNTVSENKHDESPTPTLRSAIAQLAQENEPNLLRTGTQILYLYTLNLSSHPSVPRYRTIYKNNDSFKRVQQLRGGQDLLQAVGFLDKGGFLEWEGQENDITRLKEAAAALSILKSPQQQQQNCQGNKLAKAALAVLSSNVDNVEPNTPLRVDGDFLLHGEQQDVIDDDDVILQTPQPNILVSPPSTKKHPLVSSSGFPEAPLSILNESNHSEELSTSLLDISSASLDIRPLTQDQQHSPSLDEKFLLQDQDVTTSGAHQQPDVTQKDRKTMKGVISESLPHEVTNASCTTNGDNGGANDHDCNDSSSLKAPTHESR